MNNPLLCGPLLMAYRCVALSIEGFVQQVAVSYVPFGYRFYVTGKIPAAKDPRTVDEKLIEKYGIDISPWVRTRRKQAGIANMQYIRFEDFFVLLATEGQHRFFHEEKNLLRDLRKIPIKFAGYSISFRSGHAHVRIERETFKEVAACFLEFALRRPKPQLEAALYNLPFEPYAPIRSQFFLLLRKINTRRKAAGMPLLSERCLPLRRRIYRPFDSPYPRTYKQAEPKQRKNRD